MKQKKIILGILFLSLIIYCYEKRDYYSHKNTNITIWKGVIFSEWYYLYPYKNYNFFRPGKEYIKVGANNDFLELRFLSDSTLVLCTYNENYIDIRLDHYSVLKVYGDEEFEEFNRLYPYEKCKACYSWGKIWEGPCLKQISQTTQREESP